MKTIVSSKVTLRLQQDMIVHANQSISPERSRSETP